jgi:hypothetical protein
MTPGSPPVCNNISELQWPNDSLCAYFSFMVGTKVFFTDCLTANIRPRTHRRTMQKHAFEIECEGCYFQYQCTQILKLVFRGTLFKLYSLNVVFKLSYTHVTDRYNY